MVIGYAYQLQIDTTTKKVQSKLNQTCLTTYADNITWILSGYIGENGNGMVFCQ